MYDISKQLEKKHSIKVLSNKIVCSITKNYFQYIASNKREMTNNQLENLSNHFFNSDIFCDDLFIKIASNKLKVAENELRVKVAIFTDVSYKSNNSSTLYRGKLKVEILNENNVKTESVDFLLKVSFLMTKDLKSISAFASEKLMYSDVIKSFEEIWRAKCNVIVEFSPKCYEILTTPYEVLALQDLTMNGYFMINRKIGLDLSQAKLVLCKLGKFHAASVIRYQKVIN